MEKSWRIYFSKCHCGAKFAINHALNCPQGGFIIIRHNEVRDFLASVINKVQNDVEVEPKLQPIDGERFLTRSTLTGEQAHPDIRARGFFRAGHWSACLLRCQGHKP